ncbi:UNVERIFIED_CONTAM: hypothetical protein K2H54_036999 [Gekko kuhli]
MEIGTDYCLAISQHAAQQIARMKVLLSLTVFYIMVALSHEACFFERLEPGTKDGCIDLYNGSKHPFGSKWNTSECMTCRCDYEGLECCSRYGGVVFVPGCKAVEDTKTCEYKLSKANDPSKPCF